MERVDLRIGSLQSSCAKLVSQYNIIMRRNTARRIERGTLPKAGSVYEVAEPRLQVSLNLRLKSEVGFRAPPPI